ncbi:MAG: hypothetical protein Q7S07_02640, partial [Candidatus Omnitrophota bacterium]|nr:hypothetical protein [Candidatus Omnitrophota bacterium]
MPSSADETALFGLNYLETYLSSNDPKIAESALYFLGEIGRVRTVSAAQKEEIANKLWNVLKKDKPQGLADLIAVRALGRMAEDIDESRIPEMVVSMIKAANRNSRLIKGIGQSEIERQLFKEAYLEGNEKGRPEDLSAAKAIYNTIINNGKRFTAYRIQSIYEVLSAARNPILRPSLRLALADTLKDLLTNTTVENYQAGIVVRELIRDVWAKDTPDILKRSYLKAIAAVLRHRDYYAFDRNDFINIVDLILNFTGEPYGGEFLEKTVSSLLADGNMPKDLKIKLRDELWMLGAKSGDGAMFEWIRRALVVMSIQDTYAADKKFGVIGSRNGDDPGKATSINAAQANFIRNNFEREGINPTVAGFILSVKSNDFGPEELYGTDKDKNYAGLDHLTVYVNPSDLRGDTDLEAVIRGDYDENLTKAIRTLGDYYAPSTIVLPPISENIGQIEKLIIHVRELVNKSGAAGKVKVGLGVQANRRADEHKELARALARTGIEIYIQGNPGRKRYERDDALPEVMFGGVYRTFRKYMPDARISLMLPNKSFSREWHDSLSVALSKGGSLQGVSRVYATGLEISHDAESRNAAQATWDKYGNESPYGFWDSTFMSLNDMKVGARDMDWQRFLRGFKSLSKYLQALTIIFLFLMVFVWPINKFKQVILAARKMGAAGGEGAAGALPDITGAKVSKSASWSPYRTYTVWGWAAAITFIASIASLAALSFQRDGFSAVSLNLIAYTAAVVCVVILIAAAGVAKRHIDKNLDLYRGVEGRRELERAPPSIRERVIRALMQVEGLSLDGISADKIDKKYEVNRGELYTVSTDRGAYEIEILDMKRRGFRNDEGAEFAQGEFLKIARDGSVIGIYAFMEPKEGAGLVSSEAGQAARDIFYINNIAGYIRGIATAYSTIGTYIFNLEDNDLRPVLDTIDQTGFLYQTNVVDNPAGGIQVILHRENAGANPVAFDGATGRDQLIAVRESALKADLKEGKLIEHLTAPVTPIPEEFKGSDILARLRFFRRAMWGNTFFLEGDVKPEATTSFFTLFGEFLPAVIAAIGASGLIFFALSFTTMSYFMLSLAAVVGLLVASQGLYARYRAGTSYGMLLTGASLLSMAVSPFLAVSIVFAMGGILSAVLSFRRSSIQNEMVRFPALTVLLPLSIVGIAYAIFPGLDAIFNVVIAATAGLFAIIRWKTEGIKKAIKPLLVATVAVFALPVKNALPWMIISKVAAIFGINAITILQPGILLGITAAVAIFGALSIILPIILGNVFRASPFRSKFGAYIGATVFLSGLATLVFAVVLDWSFATGFMISPIYMGFLFTIHTPVKVFLDWLITRITPERRVPRDENIVRDGIRSADQNTIFLWPLNT